MAELIATRYEESDNLCDDERAAINYRLIIGFEGHEREGFCVGEARARLVDGCYLLEETKDSQQLYNRQDTRRFSSIGIAKTRETADSKLIPRARIRARDLARITCLDFKDLTGKDIMGRIEVHA